MSRKDLKHLFTPGTGAVPPCLPDARRNRSISRIVLGIDRFLTIQAVFITVAIARDCSEMENIVDARKYDGSSGVRRPNIGQVAVLQN